MQIKSLAARAVSAIAVLAFAGSAAAQAVPPKPAGPAPLPITHGPPVAGICIWNIGTALETSNAGKGLLGSLNVMKNNVTYELTNASNSLQAKQKKFAEDARKPDADGLALNKTKLDLDSEAGNLQGRLELRQAELERTRNEALGAFSRMMDPLVIQAYQAKQCSILLPDSSVVVYNPAMDITSAVVAAANAKGQSVPVAYKVLGKLPAPAPAPAAAAAPKPKTN
ncbi:MAG: OmpH family outer membrane protein [Caulobacter sp.]|nr:OmpH family outer membrane protein [Caulobacter sp.]